MVWDYLRCIQLPVLDHWAELLRFVVVVEEEDEEVELSLKHVVLTTAVQLVLLTATLSLVPVP